MFTRGTIIHSLWRALVAGASFGLPLLTAAFPTWESITLGTIVYALLHYAQSQVGL
jgi:hypothetical protein